MKNFFITTPIYYVNDLPHIGHAYTTIAADIISRWKRLSGETVFFLTGTDEHGSKIMEAAEKTGESPLEYASRISGEFKRLWTVLNISNDDYIRTTDKRHETVVQDIFEKLKKSGDIYKGVYEDWYCLNDETYYSDADLVNGNCPACGRAVQKLKEDSYFFKLSRYEKPLLEFYENNPGFLFPKNRASEIINFVKSGLQDLSVSRTRVKWGIPVPSDPAHTVYVWFDALLNYITALGYKTDGKSAPLFETFWPCDVHLVGKEIFRFHAVIWPAMLMALKIQTPKRIFAHGWWTVDGTKMSKSLGNVVDPHKMAAAYGVDAFRYFLFREVPFGADGDFSEKSLQTRFNAELANNLGNLLQRTTTILLKQLEGIIPPKKGPTNLLEKAPVILERVNSDYSELSLGGVLDEVYGLMIKTNKYIDDEAPWKLGPDGKEKLGAILYECLSVLKFLAVLLQPFMPEKSAELWRRLGETDSITQAGGGILEAIKKGNPISFKTGQTVLKGDPLFMRIVTKK